MFSSKTSLSKRWGVYALSAVLVLLCLHVGVYYWHRHLISEYRQVQQQIQREGEFVTIPEKFQELQPIVHSRTLDTRSDVLVRETVQLNEGIDSFHSQLKHDKILLRDQIDVLISDFKKLEKEATGTMVPDFQAGVIADRWNSKLEDKTLTIKSLKEIIATATDQYQFEQTKFETAKRALLVQDVEGLESEITFLGSLYLVNPDVKLKFDEKSLRKDFDAIFTEQELAYGDIVNLRKEFQRIHDSLTPFRDESREIRRIAREKRAEQVATEAAKWIDEVSPEPEFSNIYEQINISLKEQKMYVYEDGELILSTPITSGRYNFETVKGNFKIYSKERNHLMKSPFEDQEYELWVDYWIPFYGAYGIHDSCNSRDCWRTRFGVQSYVYNGSHGCVNTPYEAVKYIYSWAHVGTTVYIY